MEKFDRQELVKLQEQFHLTHKCGYESRCKEIYEKMRQASSSGRNSVEYVLGSKGSNVETFLNYIKTRFPIEEGYQISCKLGHFYDCECSIVGGCAECVTITFL